MGSSSTPRGSSRGSRAGTGGCGTRAVSLSSTAGRNRIRSRARGRSGCCWRPSGWRPISRPSARGTRRMRRYRATAGDTQGRRLSRPPNPYQPPEVPDGKVNVTDPDSRPMMGWLRAGLQRAGGRRRAADRARGRDHQPHRRLLAARSDDHRDARRARTGGRRSGRPRPSLADAGYWNEEHMDEVIANTHVAGADPAGRRHQRQATTGLDGRPVHLDAIRPGERPGRASLPKTQTYDRAGIRAHQTQPGCHPLSPTRPNRRAHGVAITDDDPQPHEAPPPPYRHHRGLKRPQRGHIGPTRPRPGRTPPASPSPRADPCGFARRPPRIASAATSQLKTFVVNHPGGW